MGSYTIRVDMASTSSKKKIPEFSNDFGEMSLIDGLRGPKTPSNRQVLRLFLFFVSLGNSLQDAANSVVTKVLKKHSTAVCKKPRTLADDVRALYNEARLLMLSLL